MLYLHTKKLPQLIENYKTGSADGVSLAFLAVWLIGDLANLFGAIWANLVPTVIALAIYFCFADSVLIVQCLYYKRRNNGGHGLQAPTLEEDASRPLLSRIPSESVGLPGSRRGSLASRKHRDSVAGQVSLGAIPEEVRGVRPWLKYSLYVLVVFAIGIIVWATALQLGFWQPANQANQAAQPAGAMVLGYLSAVCYLGYVSRSLLRFDA